MLRQFLAERDARCPSCGYSLRAGQSHQCPECGTALELVLRARPVTAWWHVAVIGLSVSVLVLAMYLLESLPTAERIAAHDELIRMVAMGFSTQSDLIDWSMLAQIAIVLGASAVLLGWVIASRRRFAQWNPHLQIVAGVTGALSPLVLIGLLALMARGWW